ncbi:hypothetical protein ACFWR9_09055 [Streptomyces sp. NPDC058534]|uniref:hypothetical protein n=1 Tax=Streptomyces sp. NPDC058534 TaxID=3346541 RepID=UPI00365B3E7C
MFGFTTTRRLQFELAAAKAETDRQRRRAETAEAHAAVAVRNRKQVLVQNAEQEATNRRLAGRNQELTRRLEDTTEGAYTADLENRVQALARGTARWMTALWARDRRIVILQQQLHGTKTNLVASQARVKDLEEQLGKAEAAVDPRPIHGGARYPEPRDELRAARNHTAALDRRLTEVTEINARCRCGRAS